MKKEFTLLIAILLNLTLGCVDSNFRNEYSISKSFPVLVDSLNLNASNRNASWLSTANYDFLYIGKQTDTISVNYYLRYYHPPPPPAPGVKKDEERKARPFAGYYVEWLSDKRYKPWEEAEIEVFVDTTQLVKSSDINADINSSFFNAYPVLLKNKDSDTITIAYGTYVPMILEAKDSLKNWNPIEKRWSTMCGVGVGTVMLPPDEVVLSSAMIYNGNYETELRLKIGDNYSNTFRGKINHRQFLSKFDRNGGYRIEYIRENEITTR